MCGPPVLDIGTPDCHLDTERLAVNAVLQDQLGIRSFPGLLIVVRE